MKRRADIPVSTDRARLERAALRGWGGAGLAVLFLLSQLAVPMHHLLVVHSVCAEHGELVHEARGDASGSTPSVPHGTALSSGQPAGEHHHCGAHLLAPQLDRPIDLPGLEPLARVAHQQPALLGAGSLEPRVVYGFAPKTSPPQRA